VADPDTELELTGLLPLFARDARARIRAELTPTKSRKASRDHRRKFLGSLDGHMPFDPRYETVLSFEEQSDRTGNAVLAELVARGAPTECYVIAADSRYDGRTMQLDEAIHRVREGSILLCIPGRLAYHRCEYANESRIVERRD
jgi:hypothetical protein